MGRFRAPTLRNIAVTAPYMHDGSVADARRGDRRTTRRAARPSPFRSDRVRGFLLSAGEKADLVAFLESLTDQRFLTNPAFAAPAAGVAAPGQTGPADVLTSMGSQEPGRNAARLRRRWQSPLDPYYQFLTAARPARARAMAAAA